MKKLITFSVAVLVTASIWAQSPQKMSYQAVIRNASNTLVTNTTIGMKISILKGSTSGNVVYTETQTPTTNANGLVSIEIGAGAFSTIDWSAGPYFIKTETDPTGGTTYSITGTSQLLSVPYALYAKTATTSSNSWGITGNTGTSSGTNFIGTTDNQSLVFKVNNLFSGGIDPTLGNTFYGYQSGNASTTGSYNTANGGYSLQANTSGAGNTAIGYGSLQTNTGSYNTATGLNSLKANTTGDSNTATGTGSLQANASGGDNTANGRNSLLSNTKGNYNTATGFSSLSSNTTADGNTATGYNSLQVNTIGKYNTATGYNSLSSNNGDGNTASGYSSLQANSSGISNTATGYNSLLNNTGSNNTATGKYSLQSNIIGYDNTATGSNSLEYSLGNDNTATGFNSLASNTTGNDNTTVGYNSLDSNTKGIDNTAVGSISLAYNTTGSYNTALGYKAGYYSNYSNSTAIGYNAPITASYQVRIGDDFVKTIGGIVSWSTVSDKRFKKDIKENVVGLDFIMNLQPVTYHLNMQALNSYFKTPKTLQNSRAALKGGKQLQTGFIAQDVEKAAKKAGFNFSGVDAPKNSKDYYGLRYAQFVVPLVKGMQEQEKTIEAQQKEINELKTMLNKLLQKRILVSNN